MKRILETVAAKSYTTGKTKGVEKPYRRETVMKVRGVMHRVFRSAQEDDLIEFNPVSAVRTPKMREVKEVARSFLTDDEFTRFISWVHGVLELLFLSVVARCEWGLQSGDLHQWVWTMIDLRTFEQCTVPRSKTEAPQALSIPRVLSPFLRAWWAQAGKPESGPVFPVRVGKRAGPAQASGQISYAERLRLSSFAPQCFVCPLSRYAPQSPECARIWAKSAGGTKLSSQSARPALRRDVHEQLPVDFHSFRRAFNTALAEAGHQRAEGDDPRWALRR